MLVGHGLPERMKLARRLQAAGIPVEEQIPDWGDLDEDYTWDEHWAFFASQLDNLSQSFPGSGGTLSLLTPSGWKAFLPTTCEFEADL